MNERLLHLHNQARECYFADEFIDMPKQVERLILAKFAELIVRECAKVLEIQGANTGHEQYYYGASLIEEHFGVEE